MNEQKVKYVIYDLKDASIQDEVPDLLRTPLLHKFIISHFSIRTKIDNFLLLERSTEDIFNSSQLKNAPELIHILTNLDFQNIPRSEGFYKDTSLSLIGNTQRVVVNTQQKLTNYLQDHPTDSDKKFLVISSKQ